jgi:amino-acid N-acetyltransferase
VTSPAPAPGAAPLDAIVRPAAFRDVRAIYDRIKANPNELVSRPVSEIMLDIDRFLVAEIGSRIVGTVSWAVLPELDPDLVPSVEIRSLSVDPAYRRRNLGRRLVDAAVRRISALGARHIIVLTFTPPFFARLGFEPVSKEKLMYKLYQGCMRCAKYASPFTCPETAMALHLPHDDA